MKKAAVLRGDLDDWENEIALATFRRCATTDGSGTGCSWPANHHAGAAASRAAKAR